MRARTGWACAVLGLVAACDGASAQVGPNLMEQDTDPPVVAQGFGSPRIALECTYWQPMKWVFSAGSGDYWTLWQDGAALTGDDALLAGPHVPGMMHGDGYYAVVSTEIASGSSGPTGGAVTGGKFVSYQISVADGVWEFRPLHHDGIAGGTAHQLEDALDGLGAGYHVQMGSTSHVALNEFVSGNELVLTTNSGGGIKRDQPPGTPTVVEAGVGGTVITLAKFQLRDDSFMSGDGVSTETLEDILFEVTQIRSKVAWTMLANFLEPDMQPKAYDLLVSIRDNMELVQDALYAEGGEEWLQNVDGRLTLMHAQLAQLNNMVGGGQGSLLSSVSTIVSTLIALRTDMAAVIGGVAPSQGLTVTEEVAGMRQRIADGLLEIETFLGVDDPVKMRDVLIQQAGEVENIAASLDNIESDTGSIRGSASSIASSVAAILAELQGPASADPLAHTGDLGTLEMDPTNKLADLVTEVEAEHPLGLVTAGNPADYLAPLSDMGEPGGAPVWQWEMPTITLPGGIPVGGMTITIDLGPGQTLFLIVRTVWLMCMAIWAMGRIGEEYRIH